MSFTGRINNVIYENDDFRIVKVLLDGEYNPVVAKGQFPGSPLEIGAWVSFEGHWKDDPKYGKQLVVTKYPCPVTNWTDEKILSALTAQGVGMVTRKSLQNFARKKKSSLFELLNSGDLSEMEEVRDFVRDHILSRWRSLRTHIDATTFLYDSGLSSKVISRIWKTLGTELEEVVTSDPWILCRVGGITFKEADEVAKKLGVPLDSHNRIKGAVLSSIKEGTSHGDVFVYTGDVLGRVRKILGSQVDPKKVAESLKKLASEKLIFVDKEVTEGVAVYPYHNYKMEKFCADKLCERFSKGLDEEEVSGNYARSSSNVEYEFERGQGISVCATVALNDWAAGRDIKLTEQQTSACLSILTSKISIVTGLPGTGKTTTLQAVVSILKDSGIPFLLTAPTGIAAKRLGSVTGSEASTIHRAFGAKGFQKDEEEKESTYAGIIKNKKSDNEDRSKDVWGYDEQNPHPAKFVIVDECSMLDLHMLYRLLLSTSEDCVLVFVGDPYQLPSVGSGDVLRDLVSSGCFPHTHLNEIFRQENTSGIVIAAHDVHAGKIPQVDKKDFILLETPSEYDAKNLIIEIASRLYEKRSNFQVLSPRHAGDAGVTTLNDSLRTKLNPASRGVHEVRLGSSLVREGDRVMIVKNDYNLGVYNGDVGKVSYIDKRAKEIEIKIHEGVGLPPSIVRYSFKEATNALRMAYAQTVHKSQGQEYDVIVIPVLESFGFQLQRNLFYTAITRAKDKVFIVGSRKAMGKAVQNNKANMRKTCLKQRVGGLLPDNKK